MLVAQSERVVARFAPVRELLISWGLAVTHTRTRVVCETHCGRWNTESQSEWRPVLMDYGNDSGFSAAGFGSLLSAFTARICAIRRPRFSLASLGVLGICSPRMM